MDFTTLLAGGSIAGLAVGLVTGFWAKIKTWILFLCSLVVEDVELGTNETAQILLGYLLSNCKRSGLYSRFYNVTGLYDKSKRNLYVQVPAEVLGLRNVLFWYNRRPVILIRETKKVGGPTSNSTQIDCYLRFIRGTIDVDKLLKEAVAYHVKTEYLQMEDLSLQKTHANNRFYIKYYRASRAKTDGKDKAAEVDNGGKRTLDVSYGAGVYAQIYGDWAKSPSLRLIHDQPSVLSAHRKPAENNLERLYYPDEVLNLIAEMKYWLTTKLWHQAKRIPWKRGWLLHGVPGCLHPNTPIFDPVDGSKLSVLDRWKSGVKFHVLSLTAAGKPVAAVAEAPYRYELAKMLKVSLQDGSSFTVTPGHKVLVGEAWETLQEVSKKFHAGEKVLLRTTSAHGLSTRVASAQHLKKTAAGSEACCHLSSCSCDVQLPRAVSTYLTSSPSLVGAQPHSYGECNEGDLVCTGTRTRQQSSYRQPNKDCTYQTAPPTAAGFVHPYPLRLFLISWYWFSKQLLFVKEAAQCCISWQLAFFSQVASACALFYRRILGKPLTPALAAFGSSQEVALFPVKGDQTSAAEEPARIPLLVGLQPSFAPEGWSLYDTPIVAIEEVEDEVYFDFHVPVHNNYWACGAFHHNTGKTALVRAFSQDLDLPVHVFELTGMSNADFIAAWADMKTHTPCVALLEDFDNVFNGRTNRSAMASPMLMGARKHKRTGDAETAPDFVGSPTPLPTSSDQTDSPGVDDEEGLSSMFGGGGYFLTFDTFLNVLDGIEQADGIFTVITTNDLTKIDPALGVSANEPGVDSTMSTRPGRIDRVIHLTYMLPEHKIDLATWILSDFPELLADVTAEVLANPKVKETPAQFQEKCSRLALQEKFRRSIKEQS